MIDYIKGKLVEKSLGYVVVESSNIGYKILVSNITSYDLLLDEINTIYTHLLVKEDSINMVGFSSIKERDMFEILIGVSKIGVKTALSILSMYNVSDLARFIKSRDISSITKVSGLGQKTAERLVLELKDKVNAFIDENIVKEKVLIDKSNGNLVLDEAIEALSNLGFSLRESKLAVEKAYELSKKKDVQDIIKISLSI